MPFLDSCKTHWLYPGGNLGDPIPPGDILRPGVERAGAAQRFLRVCWSQPAGRGGRASICARDQGPDHRPDRDYPGSEE